MKSFVILLASLSASVAFANPFDSFIGNYAVVGQPTVHADGNVRECVRFDFAQLDGFSVVADKTGYNQTHVLRFQSDNDHLVSSHPVMEYNYTEPMGHGGSYAKTSGDGTSAKNEYTDWGNGTQRSLTVTIQKSGTQFLLVMTEVDSENSQSMASCTYSAVLAKRTMSDHAFENGEATADEAISSYAADPQCYVPAFTCQGKVQNADGNAIHDLRLLKVNRELADCTYANYDFYFMSNLKFENGQNVQSAIGMFNNDTSGTQEIINLEAVAFPSGKHLDITAERNKSTGLYEGKVIDGWDNYFSGDISCAKSQ